MIRHQFLSVEPHLGRCWLCNCLEETACSQDDGDGDGDEFEGDGDDRHHHDEGHDHDFG